MGRAQSSRSSNNPGHLLVGRVGRAVGLRGEVEVLVLSDYPERFRIGSVVLGPDHKTLTVKTSRHSRNRLILSFEEVPDRTAAEGLRGVELVVEAEHARELEAGEYWDHDLVGCTVLTTDGNDIGKVTDVLHAPANDVLVVAGLEGEHLIPLIADVIRDVRPGETITIDPIPGLLD